jgi:hypothetical protein
MNKKDLSERDIGTKFITPAVKQAGWDEMSQIREKVYFTKGRIIVRGKLVTRGNPNYLRVQHMLNKLAPIGTASFGLAIDFMPLNRSGEGKIHWRLNPTVPYERLGSRPMRDGRRNNSEFRSELSDV